MGNLGPGPMGCDGRAEAVTARVRGGTPGPRQWSRPCLHTTAHTCPDVPRGCRARCEVRPSFVELETQARAPVGTAPKRLQARRCWG